MTYTKPNIAMTETSLGLIHQGKEHKPDNGCVDSTQHTTSNGAYEVDE